MAPRWIKTKEHLPSAFSPKYDDDDWLLLSGDLVVGRAMRLKDGPQEGRWSWSLTGTSEGPAGHHGLADNQGSAQEVLLAAWRRWQEWAGVKDRDQFTFVLEQIGDRWQWRVHGPKGETQYITGFGSKAEAEQWLAEAGRENWVRAYDSQNDKPMS